jgi:hypothetical protein
VVDPTSLSASTIGPLTGLEYNPELTGTGNAELWAYFPGYTTSGQVARLNKTTGAREMPFNLPNLSGMVVAWAFAHYGGQYYIFVTTDDGLGTTTSQVLKLDPTTGMITTAVANSPYEVVGAGVSTCAPVVVN